EGRSVGLLLVRAAVAAKKVDELRERVDKLAKVPQSEFNARLVLLMLDIESKDVARARESFAELAKVADRNQHQVASDLICHVTLPAIDNPELADAAQPLLLRAVKHLNSGNNRNNYDRTSGMLLRVARVEFKNGKVDSARQLLSEYLKAQ